MGWTIVDESDTQISFDKGEGKIYVDKSSIHFGDPIVEPFLFVSWKNSDWPLMQQDSDPEQQKEEEHHIYYKTAIPLEASAAALKTAIEAMITSAFGGGGGASLTAQGDLLTHDGATEVVLPVGTDGRILMADSGVAEGIKWEDPSLVAGDDYFPVILNHGNHSPNDVTPNYFGWRLALGAEPAKNSNPAMAPCDLTVVAAKMTWRSATAGSTEVIDFYLSVWSNVAVPVLQSDTIIIQTDLTNNAATGSNNWASSGALSIDVDDGELLWAHYVGPWGTNPVNLTITLELLCKKR